MFNVAARKREVNKEESGNQGNIFPYEESSGYRRDRTSSCSDWGGRLIKSPRFSGLSTNTNVTFYCNCSNAPFTISTPLSDCLLASTPLKVHISPGGRCRPLWKPLIYSITTFIILPLLIYNLLLYYFCLSDFFIFHIAFIILICLLYSFFILPLSNQLLPYFLSHLSIGLLFYMTFV